MVSIQSIQSFVKASGVKSILQTKPQCFKGLNPAELKFAPIMKRDTVEILNIPTLNKYVQEFKQEFNLARNEIKGSYKFIDKQGKTHNACYTISDATEMNNKIFLDIDNKFAGKADLKIIKANELSDSLCTNYLKDGGILIDYMESYVPRAGTQLHKIIAQRSIDLGYKGKVGLMAGYNAHCFHYKSGFRPYSIFPQKDNEISEKLAKILEQAKKEGKKANTESDDSLRRLRMGLPEENLADLFKK